jgi:serine-type D-Ala-D-Ala carboxypeptidase (penicillin-binding protein 5/6)
MQARASHPLGYNNHYSFSRRMLRRVLVFPLLFLVVPWLPVGLLASITMAQTPAPVVQVPPIAARSWLLLDYRTGRVIASRGADERVEPASLTKLMTAYVVFGALKEDLLASSQALPVSLKAWKMPGSRMFVGPDKTVTVDELLHGMIIQSGNDATVALAEGVAGSEESFVQRMNDQAARLGLTHTHFANATGLADPHHYSTAGDLALLALALIRDFPEYFPMYAIKEYTYNGIAQRNRNELLFRDPFVDGIKTGYTETAGYCLVATAQRDGRRLLAVVTGTASETARAMEAQKLLNYGFQYTETLKLYAGGETVAELPVWKGSERSLRAGFTEDLFVSLPKGQRALLKAQIESLQPLIAPVSPQQPVGVLRLTFDDKPYGEYTVVALEPVGVANIFMRAWDSLRLMFQ